MDKKNKENKERTLLKNFINGIYTKEEAKEVLDLIKKDQGQNILNQTMNEAWDESLYVDTISTNEQEEYIQEAKTLLNNIKGTIPRTNKTKFSLLTRKSIAIAASIVVIISAAIGGYKFFNKAYGEKDLLYTEEITSYGEKKSITLPDGTQIILNACTRIKYPTNFEEDKRQIYLEGEAYFDVREDKERPFIVSTDQLKVTVLGTVFDVKAYLEDEQISVSVASGKVQVEMIDAMSRLTANEQITINQNTNEHYKTIENQLVGVWRLGSLRFNRTPIKEVAKELERVYNCRFIFTPDQDFDNLITGEHHNKSLEAVLKSIEQTSNIKAKISEDTIVLYK